jgi:citrate lyase beta subunit
MAQTLDKTVLEDELAVSLARAVAAANARARVEGIEVSRSLVTAAECAGAGAVCWRISYGPRDYVNRRGGDIIIEVGQEDGQVRRVLRGQ